MRVLHVVRQFKPGIGGLEDYVANLAQAQSNLGHAVTVLTLNRLFTDTSHELPASETVGACNVKRISYRGSHRYPIALDVFRHLDDCDLIHVHGIDFFFDALAWARLRHGKPLVVSTHGGFFHTSYAATVKKMVFHTMTRTSLWAYRAVLASSVNDRDLFAKIAHQPVELVENGVDIKKFANCSSGTFCKHLVAIGRFSSHKRLDRVLDFVAALRVRDPGWSLAIIGVEWDVKLTDLQAQVAGRGLTDSVTIQTSLTNADIAAELARASFIVSASEYEGFGIAVVEGMSAGLFPIVNDIPAFRRLHEKTGLGLLADFSDCDIAAKRFLEIVPEISRNYEAIRGLGREAVQAYAWPAVARKIDMIYDRVLGEHQRTIFGVPVSVTTREEAVGRLDAEVDAGHTAQVAFLNAHGANIARKDRKYLRCLRNYFVLNDGIGVDIASYWLYGRRFPENLNGTDFTIEYLKRTHRSYGIYLLGARQNVVTQAAIKLAAKFTRHRVVGYNDGYFAPSETSHVVKKIRRSGADILLVAFGNPLQEMWIADHLAETGCKVAFGVGALFDFVSGTIPRAPAWVRWCRAEWLFRLVLEPRRLWRRYVIGNASFLVNVLNQGFGEPSLTGSLDVNGSLDTRRRAAQAA
ncbi:MAG: WecB/TagA/CpsF family glycosyltransferase [Alphaproteobacteria bacterium]|nr:WecB/TagA/CpsF family glycosyltransferase [Alphaproteobacteria bacterium]